MNEQIYIPSKNLNIFATIKGNINSSKILVILHGGPGSGCDPLIQHPAFQSLEKTFLLIYFDQRGSGKSKYDLSRKLDLDDLTNDVHVVISYIKNRFTNKKIYLFGGSFGGALGFLYLRNYPNEVEKYIASSPAIYFTEDDVTKGFELLKNNYISKLPKAIVDSSNYNLSTIEYINNLFEHQLVTTYILSDKCTSKSLKHLLAMCPWFLNQTYISDFLNVKIPILVLHGSHDDLFFINTIKNGHLNYKNPLITFKEYLNCGHELFTDNKELFQKDIIEFINKEVN